MGGKFAAFQISLAIPLVSARASVCRVTFNPFCEPPYSKVGGGIGTKFGSRKFYDNGGKNRMSQICKMLYKFWLLAITF